MSEQDAPEPIVHNGREVSFYPQAPPRSPNQEEKERLSQFVAESALKLTPDKRNPVQDVSVSWKYSNNEIIGSLPGVQAITFKPEEGVIILETMGIGSSEGRVDIDGVSAVDLEKLSIK